MARSERLLKYNELLRIEEKLGAKGRMWGGEKINRALPKRGG